MPAQKKKHKDYKILPDRLKKRLVGEFILSFDAEFPVIMSRLGEIDEKMSKIVSNIIFMMEDITELPEHVREPVLNAITDGNTELQERLLKLHEKGTKHFWEWLDAALHIAERKIEKFYKIFQETENEKDEV